MAYLTSCNNISTPKLDLCVQLDSFFERKLNSSCTQRSNFGTMTWMNENLHRQQFYSVFHTQKFNIAALMLSLAMFFMHKHFTSPTFPIDLQASTFRCPSAAHPPFTLHPALSPLSTLPFIPPVSGQTDEGKCQPPEEREGRRGKETEEKTSRKSRTTLCIRIIFT